MQRVLEPEYLDQLAANEPAAVRSRRDLRRINAVMGNSGWIERQLRRHVDSDESVLEIGAGDGPLASQLGFFARRFDGLDLAPRPPQWPGSSQWHQTDVLRFEGWADYPVVVANLFFHHLSDEQLAVLGRRLRERARVIVASEPLRSRTFQVLFGLLCRVIHADEVTRHDGRVSIAAGFRDDELPRALGLTTPESARDGWSWRASHSPLGAYRLVAVRS